VSCFYHRWHYNLDGSLRGAPQIDQFPELSGDGKRDFGLKPASIGTWRSFIFVCASTEPRESLADWLVGVEDAFGPWDPAGMLEVEPSSFEMAANWKLFLENHIDGLHLWHLHARSVLGVAHDRQAWQACGRHWLFYEPPEIAGSMPDRDLTGLPPLTEVGEDRHGSSVFMFFPDTGGAGGVTFFTIFRVEPLSTARTRVQLRTFIKPLEETDFITDPHLADRLALATRPAVPGGESESNRATLSTAERLRRAADRMDFVEEDKIAAESVQRGYASGAYLPGPLSVDYEAAIDFYHRSCQEFLDRGPA
jgi:phenylpropionate dioxygenase-like ring-hydroxylating dioxygenase large terminal subunit